jgi:hypothetical protein
VTAGAGEGNNKEFLKVISFPYENEKGNFMDSNEVDVHEVAKALHCSDRHIQNFVRAGMPRSAHGRYDLEACKQWAKKRGHSQSDSLQKIIKAARQDRAVVQEFRRILRPLPNHLVLRLLGKSQREMAEILRDAFREAVSEFSYQRLEK